MGRRKRSQTRRLAVTCAGLLVAALAYAWVKGDRAPTPSAPDCVDSPTIPGIDVSYHQGSIAWPKVYNAGIRFAFIRVSDGLYVSDPKFRANWSGAKRAHIARGAYQFFRPEQNAIAQADALIAAIERDPGELPPALDIEDTGGKSSAQIAMQMSLWIDRVRTKLHVEPLIYASPDFWHDALASSARRATPPAAMRGSMDNADMTTQELWLAHYTQGGCPRVPAPWTRWSYWQYSKTGRVPGIRGDVDLDLARAP